MSMCSYIWLGLGLGLYLPIAIINTISFTIIVPTARIITPKMNTNKKSSYIYTYTNTTNYFYQFHPKFGGTIEMPKCGEIKMFVYYFTVVVVVVVVVEVVV